MSDKGATIRSKLAFGAGQTDRTKSHWLGSLQQHAALVVAIALIAGDLVSCIIVEWVARTVSFAAMVPAEPNVSYILLLPIVFMGLGLYDVAGSCPFERFRLRIIGILSMAALALAINLQIGRPLSELVLFVGTCLLLVPIGHYTEDLVRSRLIRADLWGVSTAVVGTGNRSRKLATILTRQPELGLRHVGFLDFGSAGAVEQRAGETAIGATSRGTRPSIALFTSSEDLSALGPAVQRGLPSCRLLFVEDIPLDQALWLCPRTLGRNIGIEIGRGLRSRRNRFWKRAVDLSMTIPACLIVLPVILPLLLAIRLVDGGPGLFVQERVGQDGSRLRVFKLRTMYIDADRRLAEQLEQNQSIRNEWEKSFKLDHDPRVLPVIGPILRRSSLDELPQLWNVLLGQMSLVGPRPFPEYHAKVFDPAFQAIRVSAPPGITGMWQITARGERDLAIQKELDLFYIRNWSIWLDLYIILETIPAVLTARGAK